MAEVFSLSKPLWEIAVRATVVYLALVVLVRIIPKRKAGHISPNDMLALIVIGGMGSSAIMGGSSSVGEILLMVGLIVAWGYVSTSWSIVFHRFDGPCAIGRRH